jgi:tetratricopeptide (TPR) repeat protein
MEKALDKMAHAMARCALPPLRGAYSWLKISIAMRQERYLISTETMRMFFDSLAMFKALGDPDMTAQLEWGVGAALLFRGDLDAAEEHMQAGLALTKRTGNLIPQTWILTWLSVLYRVRDQAELAREYALRGIQTATTTQVLENAALAMGTLAWLAWREGDVAEAMKQGRAALEIWDQTPFVYAFHWTALFPLLALAVAQEQIPEALDHAQALLHPQQQKLPESLEAALAAVIQAGENDGAEAATHHLERVIQVAKETGYL